PAARTRDHGPSRRSARSLARARPVPRRSPPDPARTAAAGRLLRQRLRSLRARQLQRSVAALPRAAGAVAHAQSGRGLTRAAQRCPDQAGFAAAPNSSKAASALAAYISEGPPPMYTATPSISRNSSGVAPSRTSALAWKPRQASQRLATPIAMAISS